MSARTASAAACRACIAFVGDAAALEAALPGLRSMGSADAAVRSDDGLCRLHGRFVSARARCDRFVRIAADPGAPVG